MITSFTKLKRLIPNKVLKALIHIIQNQFCSDYVCYSDI